MLLLEIIISNIVLKKIVKTKFSFLKSYKKKFLKAGQVHVIPSICTFAADSGNYDGYAAISMHKKDGIIKSSSFIVAAW